MSWKKTVLLKDSFHKLKDWFSGTMVVYCQTRRLGRISKARNLIRCYTFLTSLGNFFQVSVRVFIKAAEFWNEIFILVISTDRYIFRCWILMALNMVTLISKHRLVQFWECEKLPVFQPKSLKAGLEHLICRILYVFLFINYSVTMSLLSLILMIYRNYLF